MSNFNEANTVEAYVRDILCGGVTKYTASGHGLARSSGKLLGLGWHYIGPGDLPRQSHEVMVESHLSEALVRLNPEIAAKPERVDEVIYKLRAVLLSVRSDGLIRANEEFTTWLRGDRTMPFGENNQHVPVKLVDFENIENNQFVVTQQYTFRAGPEERRADLILLINGLPLVLIEAKTPVRQAASWVDGALQVHDNYERYVPELCVPKHVGSIKAIRAVGRRMIDAVFEKSVH